MSSKTNKNKPNSIVSLPYKLTWVVFAFSCLLYVNTLPNDYNLDDELVTQNHRLTSKGIAALPEIFTSPYYQDITYRYEYRPIVLASFAIEHSLFGEHAAVSHFINLLLYGLLCALLFRLLLVLFSGYSVWLAFAVAVLFAAHPLHTEVVASIKNRDEILALILAFGSLFAALQWQNKKGIGYLLAIPSLYVLSLLSKTTTLTFSVLIPLTLIYFTNINLIALFVLVTVLAVPAALLARLYSVWQQIIFFGAHYALAFFFFRLVQVKFSIEEVKELYHKLQQQTEPAIGSHYKADFSFLKTPVTAAALFAVVVLPVTLTAIGFYTHNIWLSTLPVAVLLLVFLYARDEIKLILLTPITLGGILAIVLFRAPNSLIEASLIMFLSINILSPVKWLRVAAIIHYAVYACVAMLFADSYLFAVILFFVGFINRKLLPVTIVIAVLSVVSFGKNVLNLIQHNSEFKLALLALPFIYLGFFMLRRNKQKLLLLVAAAMLPLTIALYYWAMPPGKTNGTLSYLAERYYQLNTTAAADLTPVQSARPLSFAEYPLQNNKDIGIRSGTALEILLKYAKLLVIPYPLSFYYGYAEVVPVSIWSLVPLTSLALHLLLAVAGWWYSNKNRLLSYSIFFYLITAAAISGIAMPVPGMMADRFLFIPSLAFCLALIVALTYFFKIDLKNIQLPSALQSQPKWIFVAVLALYSIGTVARNFDWKNRLTLFSTDIHHVPNSAQAHNLLAIHLLLEARNASALNEKIKMRDEALIHLRKALDIHPQFQNASYDLARLYDDMQQYDMAAKQYQHTLEIDSNFALPCYRLGIILQSRGEYDNAIAMYEKYLRAYPAAKDIYANLSYTYFKKENYEQALLINRMALQKTDSPFEPWVNMAKIFSHIGNADSAAVYYELAYQHKPDQKALLRPLIEAFTKSKRSDKAAYYMQQVQ